MDDLLKFPVGRLADNRLNGLLRELAEAIEDSEDPETLRKAGQSLRMLSAYARGKGLECGGKFY